MEIFERDGQFYLGTNNKMEFLFVQDLLSNFVKHGQWVDKEDPYGFFDHIPVCSECGCTTKMREKYHYCPNCGAKMDEIEEDEESE